MDYTAQLLPGQGNDPQISQFRDVYSHHHVDLARLQILQQLIGEFIVQTYGNISIFRMVTAPNPGKERTAALRGNTQAQNTGGPLVQVRKT